MRTKLYQTEYSARAWQWFSTRFENAFVNLVNRRMDIRNALKRIEPERLVISSDCGFGRQGKSRTHDFYKMVSLVWGTNIVRQELGLEPRPILATDKRYALM
jgi:hypothetical protein